MQSINDHLHPLSYSQKNQWSQEVAGLVLTHRLHRFIKHFQSWAIWKHKTTREKTEKHPAAIIYSGVKFWAGSTENYNQPKLWHTVCTILEGPLGSFLSTSNQNHLPRCLRVRHKCKESNGLILPWPKFASLSLLQTFIKVGSLVALLPSISSHLYTALWLNATTREVFIFQSPPANASHISSHLLCQTWYVSNTKTLVPCPWTHY